MKKIYAVIFFSLAIHFSYGQWYLLNSGVTTHLRSVYCLTDSIVFVTGDNGVILKTTDGGATWNPKNSGTFQSINSIFFADSLTGYAVGYAGVILKTTDGGNTWSMQPLFYGNNLTSVFFTAKDTGYAVGHPPIFLRTTNGGTNWISDSSFYPCCGYYLNNITFVSKSKAYVLGYDLPGTMILSTTDTARTWTLTADYNATSDNWWQAYAMCVDSSGMPIVAGDLGRIQNGYGMWNMFGAPVGNTTLNSVCSNHNGGYTAVGTNGVIGLYPNMGPGTCNQSSGVTTALNSIQYYDTQVGYIAGNNGVILKTLNAGVTNSIDEIQNSNSKNISVYPNPTNGTFNLSISVPVNNAYAEIYNALGVLVQRQKITAALNTIELNQQANGLYLVKIADDGKIIASKKIIRQ